MNAPTPAESVIERGGRASLEEIDPEIATLIARENVLEDEKLRLIASENYVSRAVIEATRARPHEQVLRGLREEALLRGVEASRSTKSRTSPRSAMKAGLRRREHCRQRPASTAGAPANLAVYLAFVKPGEPIMGLGLPAGGHLTHGWNVSITGKIYKSIAYGVRESDHRIDMDQVRDLAKEHQPKLIWCGTHGVPARPRFRCVSRDRRRGAAPSSRPTSPTSPASSPAASTPRRSASPTW